MNKIYSKNNFKNNWNKKSFGMFFVFSFFTLIFTFISIFPNLVLGAAGVPALINFQGRLLDSSGNLLGGTSGTEYCYKFSIYDAVSAGSKIWPAGSPSTMTITTREGVFNANVGDTGAGGDTLDLAFTDDQAFMNVEVATKVGATCAPGDGAESFETLSPRQRIVSSAFAINSKTVGGFTPAQSATGSQIPALTSGSLVLGDTNPGLRVTGSNTLTFQSGVTGDIQFYSSSNKITSVGALTIAGGFTSSAGTITLGGLGGGGTQCLQVDNSGVVTGTGGVCGAGSVTWNSLTNPTGTQSLTFDDGELNAWTVSSDTETFQTITANSLTTGKVLAISSSSLSSGSLVDLTITGTAGLTGQKALNISLSGANGTGAQTTYGAYLSNTHTGTSTNVGLYATASGGSNNYAAIFEDGRVGIGITSPETVLDLRGTSFDTLQIKGTTGVGSGIGIEFENTTAVTGKRYQIANYDNGDFIFRNPAAAGNDFFRFNSTGNLILLEDGGNVGIGDTSPASLFTVGSGDLFQINSTGQIGSQQAPVSDYLFSLAGTTGNDNSRIIDITQANNADEDSSSIYITGTPTLGAIAADRSIRGSYLSLTPSLTVPDTRTANIIGNDTNISLSNLSHGDITTNAITSYTTGNRATITGNPVFNDTSGIETSFMRIYGTYSQVSVTPTLTNVTDGFLNTYGGYFLNASTSAGDVELINSSIGIASKVSGDLTTTGNTSHYGGHFDVSGSADINYGIYSIVTGGSTNYSGIFTGGNFGIGDTNPASLFTVGSGDLFQVNNSGDILTPNTEPLSITTGTTGALTLDTGTTGTINIGTGTAGKTINLATDNTTKDTLNIGSVLDDIAITSDSWSVTNAGVLTVASCTGCGGVSSWSDITNPTGTQSLTFDDGELNAWTVSSDTETFQTITANSLTTGKVLAISSSSLSSGSLIDLTVTGTAAASNTQKALNISLSGANATSTQTTYGGYISNTHTGTSSTNVGLYLTASGATTNLGLNVDSGQTLLGGTTLTTGTLAKLNIVSTNSSTGSTTAIAGIHGEYTFNNGGASSYVQVGNRFVFNNAPTTNSNTMVGEVIRTIDNTTLANLVRGIEIVSNAGSNTAGTNVGIRTTGATFGIQAITNGAAGGQALPAAIFGENTGTTQGDILRLYSTSMTSAAQMAQFYHNSSTFTGTGLLMDFAEGSGTFSGNFVDFQKNNTSLFKVTNGGVTSLGFTTSQAYTSAVCSNLANATAPTADVQYTLYDCGSTPVADYAEMYPVESGIEFGDIVVTGTELVETYDTTNGAIDWTKVKGTITKLVKSNKAYQGNVIGIVSDNFGDFSSTGYNIKEGDNPMPVALVGRLPVKIASTSSDIKAGDYITTSSELGRGMKAVKAGVVIGKALEDWTATSGKETVMVFVEQGYYNGVSATSFAGIDMNTTAGDEVSKQILAKLILEENNIDPLNISELLTDRVVAGLEIITPDLVAENVNTDNLIVEENAKFAGLSNFIGEASFMNKVSFENVVEFKAPPMWNSDTAGFATVLAGAKKVEVIFDNPYIVQPIVNASISLEDNLENENENMTEEEINNFFNQDIKYVITNKTQNGFTININKESDKDIKFSWVALAVKDAKNFESLIEGLVIENNSNVNPPTINPEIENNPTSENPEENNSSTESVLGDTTTNIEENTNTNTNTESTNDTNSESAQTIVTETIDESASSNTSIIESPSESTSVIE